MFSKKIVMIIALIVLFVISVTFLSLESSRTSSNTGFFVIYLVAPVQENVTRLINFVRLVWSRYFFLVSVAKKNEILTKKLSLAIEKNNRLSEIETLNFRLRDLLDFKAVIPNQTIAAEVVGRDPSFWFKAIIINKGKADGISKGLSVTVPEGIVGQIIDVSHNYSKALLLIDQNSAVDALAQRIRARGIIKGMSESKYCFEYVLRKHDIKVGDAIISSGLDGVFPKGLRIGYVSDIVKQNAGIFQEVKVVPYVDFERLEEVLVVIAPPKSEQTHKNASNQ